MAGNNNQGGSAPTQIETYAGIATSGEGQRAAGAASVVFGLTITPSGSWVEAGASIKAAAVAPSSHNLMLMGVGQ
jgi:hypothetical protein